MNGPQTRTDFSTDLHWLSLSEAAHAIAHKQLSPVELTQALLKRIERLDPRLNAFIKLDGDAALAAAQAAETEIMAGRSRGPLHGVPVGIKDIMDTVDFPTQMGSPAFKDWQPKFDAACVQSLRRGGAIVFILMFVTLGPTLEIGRASCRERV